MSMLFASMGFAFGLTLAGSFLSKERRLNASYIPMLSFVSETTAITPEPVPFSSGVSVMRLFVTLPPTPITVTGREPSSVPLNTAVSDVLPFAAPVVMPSETAAMSLLALVQAAILPILSSISVETGFTVT